jgi:hypothetical protein
VGSEIRTKTCRIKGNRSALLGSPVAKISTPESCGSRRIRSSAGRRF